MSLASQLYAAYVDSPTPIPLEQLPKREQEAWARVAVRAREIAGAEMKSVRDDLEDADNERCRLTHHQRKRGCSIPDCGNYTLRAEDDVG